MNVQIVITPDGRVSAWESEADARTYAGQPDRLLTDVAVQPASGRSDTTGAATVRQAAADA